MGLSDLLKKILSCTSTIFVSDYSGSNGLLTLSVFFCELEADFISWIIMSLVQNIQAWWDSEWSGTFPPVRSLSTSPWNTWGTGCSPQPGKTR